MWSASASERSGVMRADLAADAAEVVEEARALRGQRRDEARRGEDVHGAIVLRSSVLGGRPSELLRARAATLSFEPALARGPSSGPSAPGVRGTASASRSFSTSRSIASSRFRSWLRSSCATARRTGPARSTTRRFWISVSADDASTSKTASTRVEDFCACWPPGPLERETRSSISDSGRDTERVTRISCSGTD